MVFERVTRVLEVVFYGLYVRPWLADVACFIYQTSSFAFRDVVFIKIFSTKL